VTADAPAEAVTNPAMLLDYLVERMMTGYEQDDDVTVLVVHSPRRAGGASVTSAGGAHMSRAGGAQVGAPQAQVRKA
jgi:hypothetical protein